MRSLASGMASDFRYPYDGTQPSAALPTNLNILGLYAPSQMPIGGAGTGPALRPASW